MTPIVDKSGNPIRDEIATIEQDITFPSFLGVLRNRDDTLLTRASGGSMALKIYDDIERDCHAFAVLQKRKLAVVARPWDVKAASKSKKDKMAADMVREHIDSMDFDSLTFNALDALLKGFSVGEIMWDVQGNEIGIKEVIPRDQRRFTFGDDRSLRMLTWQDMVKGDEMPDRKFIVHSFGGKDGNPFGLGMGTRLFWPVYFKRQDIKFWLTFADKFGSPTLKGTYQSGSSTQKQELLDAMAAISQDAGIAVPQGVVIELLESARSSSTDTYEKMARFMDEQMSEAVLGETMTTNSRGANSLNAGGQANVHNEVRMELVRADADMLSGTLNRTLSTWLTEFNMPGANPPRVTRIVEEPQDLLQRAERDAYLYKIGRDLDDETFEEVYGSGYVRIKPPVNNSPGQDVVNGVAPGSHSSFSESPSAAEAGLTDQLGSQATDPWDAVVKHVQQLVDNATSMQELQDALLKAYDGLPFEELRKVMAQGFQVAALAGMAAST